MDAQTVVKALGGPTVVARKLKSSHTRGHVSTAAVSKWECIPADRCIEVAGISAGRFTPEQLRPDLKWMHDATGRVVGYLSGAEQKAA